MFYDNKHIKIRKEGDNIVIDGDIIIYDNDYTEFPVKIHKVNGSITWKGHIDGFRMGALKSLKNFPDIVTGNVHIYKNPKLTSLTGCPEKIGGSLICNDCNISDITGIAKEIGGNFICANNPVSDISVLSESKIGGVISLIGTKCSDNITVEDTSIIFRDNYKNTRFNE